MRTVPNVNTVTDAFRETNTTTFGSNDYFSITLTTTTSNFVWGFTPYSSEGTWYCFDWGDGTAVTSNKNLDIFTNNTRITHTFSTPGTYTIKLAMNADTIEFDAYDSDNGAFDMLGNPVINGTLNTTMNFISYDPDSEEILIGNEIEYEGDTIEIGGESDPLVSFDLDEEDSRLTPTGTVTYETIDGHIMARFNGSSYLTYNGSIDLPLGNSPRTIMAWVYADSTVNTSARIVFGYGLWDVGRNYCISTSNGKQFNLGMAHYGGAYDFFPGISGDIRLLHIAATYNGSKELLYVNGELYATKDVILDTKLSDLCIGSSGSDHNRYFTGCVGKAKLFDYVLSAKNIKDIYQRELNS